MEKYIVSTIVKETSLNDWGNLKVSVKIKRDDNTSLVSGFFKAKKIGNERNVYRRIDICSSHAQAWELRNKILGQ